jgi:hypothetical protein
VGVTENEIQAQEQLVAALQAQETIQSKVADLKKLQGDNAKHATGKTMDEEAFRALKAQLDAEKASNEAEDKLQQEAHNKAIAELEQSEREKIEATEKGSAGRLAAIDAALKEENKYGLQETGFYRSLLTGRVQLIRDMSLEENKLRAEAGKEAADHAQKMGELELAAEREKDQLRMSAHHTTEQQRLAEEEKIANQDYQIKLASLQKQVAALDKGSHEYENKLKALQNKETELTKQHENEITAIKDKAEMDRNARMLAGINKEQEMIASGFASVLMRHQSFGAMMLSIEDQIATGMLKNALVDMMTMDMTRERDAAHAARQMFIAGSHLPFPANIVAAPAMGAAAFAAVMAFADGGMVPGVGRGDIVPAMLTPGEHVADKELTDGLRGMVRNGGTGGGHSPVHLHYRPTYHVNTIDGDGIRGTLSKHADEFHKHVEKTLRRMNH